MTPDTPAQSVPPDIGSSAQLVRAAQSGQRSAFDVLVQRYFGMVYAIGLARLEDGVLAQDLAQEVFLRAYLGIGRLQNPDAFPGWITAMARNLATDWQRRGNLGSRITGMVPLDASHEQIPDLRIQSAREKMETDDRIRSLREALHKLPPDHREMVLLHFMEGISQEEIAQRLGLHRTSVGRTLARALKRMRAFLVPALQDALPRLRAPNAAASRTIALIGAAAGLGAAQKSAIAAACAASAPAAATATASAMAFSIKAFLKTVFGFIKSGGTVVGTSKAIAVTATALIAIGGGAYYLFQEIGSNRRNAGVSGESLIPPPSEWRPYTDWNELATIYAAQHPENLGFRKLAQALKLVNSPSINQSMDSVAGGWAGVAPELQAALEANQPAVDAGFAAAQHAPFPMPPIADETVPIPDFLASQNLFKMMLASARMAEASGDLNTATQRAVATARLSESFCSTGTILISHFIGIAGVAASGKTLASLLHNPGVTPQIANSAWVSLKDLESKRVGFAEAIRGDARYSIRTTQLIKKGNPVVVKKMGPDIVKLYAEIDEKKNEKKTVKRYQTLVARFELPFYQRPPIEKSLLFQLLDPLLAISLPVLDESAVRSETALAWMRLCQALAALKSGNPDAVKNIRDPFTGKPISVIADKVYSVGPDGKDQGSAVLYNPTNGTFSAGDVSTAR